MAFSVSTLNFASGAVSDFFAASAAKQSGALNASSLNLQASGLRLKAQGDIAESQQYDLAAALAAQNKQYTIESTVIQQAQLERQVQGTIGSQTANIAASGLKNSGSALDLLADSASQGRLAHDVLAKQALITEAGYEEQAQSYNIMSSAAKAAAAGEMSIASQTDNLAVQTQQAANKQAKADYISAGIKGAAAIATLAIPAPT